MVECTTDGCDQCATVHRFGETWLCEEHNLHEAVRLNLKGAEDAAFYFEHFGHLAVHVLNATLIDALEPARRKVNAEIARLRAELPDG